MKNLTIITLCIVPCILCNTNIFAINTLSFFIRPYPDIDTQQAAHTVAHKIQTPGKLAKYMMPHIEDDSVIGGIFSTYAGYLSYSDPDGKTSFPLRHNEPLTYYLITPEIFPVMMFGNTIDRWDIIKDVPASLFKVEKKKDEDLGEYYWQVTAMPLPEDKKIAKRTVVVFAKPSNIYIPEGVTPISNNSQMILPDLYVKKNISKAQEALYVLTIKQFFAPLTKGYQHEPLRHIVQMTEL